VKLGHYRFFSYSAQEATVFLRDLAESVEVTLFEGRKSVEQRDTVVAVGRWGGRTRRTRKTFECKRAMPRQGQGSMT